MNKKYKYLVIVLIIIISFIALGRSLGNDFVNYDDGRLITENINIQSGFNAESIKWSFTNSSLEYWHPLTWLSLILEWSLFGTNAFGYHLISLLLHIGSAILFFLFLNKTTGSLWASAFATAVFAIHPLRVESVAWASERKDVLSMFFGMATIYAYAFYVKERKLSKYIICLILFVLALMCKPMLATLPCVLLLLDYWPLSRLQKELTPQKAPALVDKGAGHKKSKKLKAELPVVKRIANPGEINYQLIGKLLLEKIPFFFLSLAFGIMIIFQLKADKHLVSTQQVSISDRIINALVSYVSYLVKTFWPVDLAVFYPYVSSFPLWQVIGASLLLGGISIAVIYLARKVPFLIVGWFWYLGTLFPVIGLMQAGDQAIADRYTYLPSIGIAIMVTWGGMHIFKEKLRKIIIVPAIIILAALIFLTWQQCGYWKNTISLFAHALQATKDNYLAHTGLGEALVVEGKTQEAISHYRAAIEINPYYSIAHAKLGEAIVAEGKTQEAISHYRAAIKIQPYNAITHYNLAIALEKLGNVEDALTHYQAAVRILPNYAKAYANLGFAFEKLGNIEEAMNYFRRALLYDPNLSDVHNRLGNILDRYFKNYDQAIYHYRQALKTNPNNPGIHYNLGNTLSVKYFNSFGKEGNLNEALDHFRRALALNPDFEPARRSLKMVLEADQKLRQMNR